VLSSRRRGEALDLEKEDPALRARYGRGSADPAFGEDAGPHWMDQFLMARRLVEAGVRCVTLSFGSWDRHGANFERLPEQLAKLDQGITALVADLHDRGLLESTLVVAVGEFGRTPKLGQFSQSSNTRPSGRDHWPHAFTALVAGGGVRGGQVYGASNSNAGYVVDKPVTPADLTATILTHLGVDPQQEYPDEFQQLPRRLSEGHVITDWS